MDKSELINVDCIADDELVRRDVFIEHYNEETGEISVNLFQLRNSKPPENYLSFWRCKYVRNVKDTLEFYAKSTQKRVIGYSQLLVQSIRCISVPSLRQSLLPIGSEDSVHSGLFVWHNDELIDGSIDSPEMLILQQLLVDIAQPCVMLFDK